MQTGPDPSWRPQGTAGQPPAAEEPALDDPPCAGRDDVRHYLEVSTANLPHRLWGHIDRCPGILAWPHDLGAYIYVPAGVQELRDTEADGCPPELLQLLRHAIALGCSLIDLRRDVPPDRDQPVYDGDQRLPGPGTPPSGGPPLQAPNQPPSPPGPPPGWYGDPAGRARLRWWDGSTWSGHTSP